MFNSFIKKLGIALVIFLGVFSVYYLSFIKKEERQIITVNSFEECVEAGFPVMESYPRQCTASSLTFTEYIGNEIDKADLIRVQNPRPNQSISSRLEINGEARGNWFFEASFPAYIYDAEGKQIGIGIMQAQIDPEANNGAGWMTENFVPFKGYIEFETQQLGKGILILRKDNPSGLPEHDDELVMPIIFSSQNE